MTHFDIQSQITQNLLLGLKKQSEAYLELISNNEYTHDQRKDFEKELSDINKVLNELSNKTVSYTVQELEQLKITFNDKLTELSTVITDLEVNTLKIEFNSLTPEQKEFLRGEKGEKGNNGLSSYELAKLYGFEGNEIDYLNSLKGAKGDIGLTGAKGENGQDGISFTFDMFTPEQLEALKGADGKSLTYQDLDRYDRADLVSYFNNSLTIQNLNNSISEINSNIDSFNNVLNNLNSAYDSLNQRIIQLENNQGSTAPGTPTDPNEIEAIDTYRAGTFFYQNKDLLTSQKYFAIQLLNGKDYQVGDKIEMWVFDVHNNSFFISLEIKQQEINGYYYFDILANNSYFDITVLAKFLIDKQGFIFALETTDNGSIVYPFKKYEISHYRNDIKLSIDSNVFVAGKSFFDDVPSEQNII